MPPKKKGEVEEKMVLIGRMGTNLKVNLRDNPSFDNFSHEYVISGWYSGTP